MTVALEGTELVKGMMDYVFSVSAFAETSLSDAPV